jgi:hypothetical protein
MSRCLTDEELQSVADREAPPDRAAHASQCPRCSDRLAARKRLIDDAVRAVGSDDLPLPARAAIRSRLESGSHTGATTLRHVRVVRRWAWGVPVAAGVVIVLLFVVGPGIDRHTTVSAAEILARSRTALAAPAAGIEVLTYDLDVEGVLADLIPEEQSGRFTVEELVDHDHPGRFRIVKLAADGQVVGGAADDPLHRTRIRYVRVNGRGFLLTFDGAEPAALSLLALKRSALQTFIGVMQASSGQTMTQVPCANEACYQVDVPANAVPAGALVGLDSARAIIAMADARLVEFSASGRLAGRPFRIDFALRSRELRPAASVQDADFDIAPQPGDVILNGSASDNPLWDVVSRALAAVPDQAGRAENTGNPQPASHERY